MNLLAGVCVMMEDYARAEALYSEALPVERQYFPHDVQLSRSLGGLASMSMQRGELDAALPPPELPYEETIAEEDSDFGAELN